MKNIAFIGATGLLGMPVANALVAAGYNLTALVRNPSEERCRQLQNVRLIPGNMNNPVDLNKLLTGQDAVYLNLSVKQNEKEHEWHTEREGIHNLLAVAREAGIRRVFYLSALLARYEGINGFSWWVFQLKHDAVKAVKGSGIPYTIFYPSTFMEALTSQYKQGNRMLLAGESRFPQYFIAAADYASQVVNAVRTSSAESREYVVQGPEPYTTDNAVTEFINHYSKAHLKTSRAPVALIKFLGTFSQKLDYGYHIIEALNNYPEKFEAENTWKDLGRPTITIREFAGKA